MTERQGTCTWCHKEFTLVYPGVIPSHRNPGDKYECLGSLQMCSEDVVKLDKILKGGTKR